MDFKDRRIWYAVAAVIIVLIIGYATGWFGSEPAYRSSKPALRVRARCAAWCRALAALTRGWAIL